MRRLLPLLLALVLLPLPAAAAARRIAVLVANAEGGPGTRPLRYAERDARRVLDALARLGGVAEGDAFLLLGGDAAALERKLAEAEAAIAHAAAAGARTELVFYYSGHAKDGQLHLGTTPYAMATLKERLAASGAAVRIAFLDACRSGAITRTKGARRVPAFEVDAGPRAAKGLVILTSSSTDEDSQESDRISGSFFTHALVSGMLGEADASGDRRVTLAEAYAYAYDRTVAGTVQTSAGPQHPTFAFDLAGRGDVVLTDLRGPAVSFLVLPAELEGDFLVVEEGSRFVAAEIQKRPGAEARLALAPGAYLVKTRLPDRLRVGEVEVRERGATRLDPASMYDVDFDDDPVKGVVDLWARAPSVTMGALVGYQHFLAGPVREGYFPDTGLLGIEAELRDYLRPGWNLGLDLALGSATGTTESGGLAYAYAFSALTAGASLTVDLLHGPVRPFVGARLALVYFERRFDEPLLEDQSLFTTAPGLVAGLGWYLADSFALTARLRPSWLLYAADENRSLGFVDASAGARMEF